MANTKKKTTKRKTSATKSKKGSKKNTRSVKSTKKSKQADVIDSDVLHVCLFLCLSALTIITVFKIGTVGSIVFNLFSLFFGNICVVFLVAATLYSGYRVLYDDKIKTRYLIGLLCLAVAWMLLQSSIEFDPTVGFAPVKYLATNSLSVLQGEYVTKGGFIGSLFLGVFTLLLGYMGCYIIIALLVILSITLLAWNFIHEFLGDISDEREIKQEVRQTRKLELKEQKRQQRREEIIASANAPRQSIFLNYNEEDQTRGSLFIDVDDINAQDPPVKNTKVKSKRKPKYLDEQPVSKAKPVKIEPVPMPEQEPEPVYDVEPVQQQVEQTEPEQEVTSLPVHYVSNGEEVFDTYKTPSSRDLAKLLDRPVRQGRSKSSSSNVNEMGNKLIMVLEEFGVDAQLIGYTIGPSVTQFEIKPAMGVRVSKISNLQNDIKMALAATDIRIEAPIPGKNAVGIEIPNQEKTSVQMSELIYSVPENKKDKPLLFCLGKDLNGQCIYGEMNRMPHLLIAGATGSGKSVCVNSIICSILLRTKPSEVKLILVDPKKVEFTPYNDVPHLLAPVITDSEMANKALKVVVQMMDARYDLFSELGVRNITAYNQYLASHQSDENTHLKPLPWIVVIIDELADLMLVAAKEVEGSIQRITQLARAAGIHLIVATQRPSVDVITGVIKANIPSRIAFAVSQAVDSRTILDQAGAEKLLGYGDMLYLPNGETAPKRIQGVFIKDEEVNRITDFVKSQKDKEGNIIKPRYDDAFITLKEIASQGGQVAPESSDPLYNDVKSFVIQSRRASTSLIQRKFSIGYSRAARLIDVLEESGIIGPANGSKPREILVQNTLEDDVD